MDYEKKLKETLVNGNADYEVVRWIEQTFPELKESEDEKIRKDILAFIKRQGQHIDKYKWSKWIAWLEKQDEQKPAFEMKTPEESLGIDSDTYNKIVDECVYGEQNPADEIEPKFKAGDRVIGIVSCMQYYITEICDGYYNTESGCTIMFYAQDNFELYKQEPTDADLKDIVDKEANSIWKEINTGGTHSVIDSFNQFYGICMQVAEAVVDYRKPVEWSEEDERSASYICAALDCYYRLREERNNTNGQEDLDKARNWLYSKLKSLKNKVQPQPKQEWSEEDERTYKSIIYSFAHNYPLTIQQQEFIKSLRSHWKPSDEQMWALSTTIANIPESASYACKKTVEGLLEQLKKLKG